jgi:hypothetical protein
MQLYSLWRHWIPETDFLSVLNDKDPNVPTKIGQQSLPKSPPSNSSWWPTTTILAAALLVVVPQVGLAVSGGGLDYAGLDISGQDFSNGNYKGKDFTQVIAKGTKFAKSNLQGCRFYKAYLVSQYRHGGSI